VSSTYSIFCLSHDPVIEADDDVPSRDEAITWASEGFGHHPTCDLLVARYSGGLIELGCPAMGSLPGEGDKPRLRFHPGWHRDTVWAEAGLLRVAAAVIETEADGHADLLTKALKRMPMCWTVERLHRLRYLLEAAL
jgi:hypothetical protein